MKQGDAVEVNQVWASQGKFKPLLRDWFKGYEFVRVEGDVTIVKHVEGLLSGVEVRYPSTDVRPA